MAALETFESLLWDNSAVGGSAAPTWSPRCSAGFNRLQLGLNARRDLRSFCLWRACSAHRGGDEKLWHPRGQRREEEPLRPSASGAEPSVNCNNSSSMREITEAERGYPHSADRHARENSHRWTNKHTCGHIGTGHIQALQEGETRRQRTNQAEKKKQ